jgi:hypothetical protein
MNPYPSPSQEPLESDNFEIPPPPPANQPPAPNQAPLDEEPLPLELDALLANQPPAPNQAPPPMSSQPTESDNFEIPASKMPKPDYSQAGPGDLDSWGRMSLKYLEDYKPQYVAELRASGKLYPRLLRNQTAAHRDYDQLMAAGWSVEDAQLRVFQEYLTPPTEENNPLIGVNLPPPNEVSPVITLQLAEQTTRSRPKMPPPSQTPLRLKKAMPPLPPSGLSAS